MMAANAVTMPPRLLKLCLHFEDSVSINCFAIKWIDKMCPIFAVVFLHKLHMCTSIIASKPFLNVDFCITNVDSLNVFKN